jgi:putative tricarboxylic transport membrane protein
VLRSELALATGVAALGAFLLVGIPAIRFGAGYDRIGPRFFPYAVAAGLIFLGAWLAVGALRARAREPQFGGATALQPPLNWAPIGYLGLALILNLALLERAGFVIASSIQFWLAARAFHSRRPVRDAVIAVLLSVVVYIAFSQFLGLTLPAGPLESLF